MTSMVSTADDPARPLRSDHRRERSLLWRGAVALAVAVLLGVVRQVWWL